MAERSALRIWATPLTIGAFLLVSVTGLLMFFELDRGLTTVVHQWLSWCFVVGAVGHITVNIRPLKNHLKSNSGKVSVATFLTILLASFSSWGLVTGPQLERPIEEALIDAPLSALASVTHTAPDVLLRKLEATGISATSEQSIRELSEKYGESENRLLAIVFLAESP